MAVATESRIVFAAIDEQEGGSLDYADLASIQTGDGEVVVRTCEGVRCQLPLAGDEPGTHETCAHLRWVGDIRSEVVASRNDVDLAVGEIRDHASAMEWEKAEMKYAEMRGNLDSLLVRLDVAPLPDAALAPELTELERTLEKAYVRMLVERAESELELADQLLVNGDYDRVGSVLCEAERYSGRARSHAAVLERPDSFRFGEQREIFDSLDRVTAQIEDFATQLLGSGNEARRRAATTGEPEAAIDRLETALECYRSVRAMGLGDPPPEARVQQIEETLASLREVASEAESRSDEDSGTRGGDSRGREAPPEMVTNGPAQGPEIEEAASDGGDREDPPSHDGDTGTRVTDKVINQLTQAIRRSEPETE